MSVTIRPAGPEDAERLNAALARLSEDLGDTHMASIEDLRRAGWRENPAFRALLAQEGGGELRGVALYSPVFSTVRGQAGVYVSDLWIDAAMRGRGLGRELLAEVSRDAEAAWGARFMKLTVYDTSPGARRFYERLGFVPAVARQDMLLDRAGCEALKGAQ